MIAGATVQRTKSVRRRPALEPYLLKLQDALRRDPGDPNRARTLSIDGAKLSLGAWVVAGLDLQGSFLDGGPDRAELMRQALALWLKSALDVRSLRRELKTGSVNLYEAQANVMLDSGLGAALLQDLQEHIDGLVQQGDLEEAKRFSKFRNQVSGIVRELKQSIAESNEPDGALPAAPPVGADPEPVQLAPSALAEPDFAPHVPLRRPRPPQTRPAPAAPGAPKSRYRTQILLALDLVALLVLAMVTLPSRTGRPTPGSLTARDFQNGAQLVGFLARPPALYATVDDKVWSGYDAEQKRRFVDAMGIVLRAHGYWGLSLKTSDGALVGQWFDSGGARLLQPGPTASSAPGQTVTGKYSRFVP